MFGAEDVQMIHLAVKKQWYGHDLAKISSGCLPQNLKACKKTILSGHYTLQINSITSLGKDNKLNHFLFYQKKGFIYFK